MEKVSYFKQNSLIFFFLFPFIVPNTITSELLLRGGPEPGSARVNCTIALVNYLLAER